MSLALISIGIKFFVFQKREQCISDRYRRGAHTICDIKYHIVWKTKYSYGVLKGNLALRARHIIRQICETRGLQIVSGNIRANHVHLLISCPSDLAPSKIIQHLKGMSSYLLQREFKELQKRYWGQHLWARGYFCSTVGAVNEDLIKKYVENQIEDEGDFKIWDMDQKLEEIASSRIDPEF